MAVSFDLMLSSDNDLIFDDANDLVFTKKKSEIVMQRLGITLRTFQGEWFLDRSFGVPYLQEIIGVARKKEVVNSILLSKIISDPDVRSVSDYKSSFDRYDRSYKLTATINLDEENIVYSFDILPSKEWIYPIPNPDDPRVTCEKYEIQPFANILYKYENIEGLPDNTYSTWWNQWVR